MCCQAGPLEEHEAAVGGHATRGTEGPRRIRLGSFCVNPILAVAAFSSTESIGDTCFCIKVPHVGGT